MNNDLVSRARELAAWLRDCAITAEDACKADGDNEVYADAHRKTLEAADLLETLAQPMGGEAAWREGWASGYRAGYTDGGSDSNWCDEEGDWAKSKTRAALASQPLPVSDQ